MLILSICVWLAYACLCLKVPLCLCIVYECVMHVYMYISGRHLYVFLIYTCMGMLNSSVHDSLKGFMIIKMPLVVAFLTVVHLYITYLLKIKKKK